MARQISRMRGAKEFDRVLKALPDRLAKQEMGNALSSAGSVIAKEARRSAPRGDEPSKASKKYGPLHRNIRVRRRRRTPHAAQVLVSNGAAFWGFFIEFGTSKMAARPWFRPAIQRAQGAALDRFAERLKRGIDRQATALAGKFKSLNRTQRRALRW